jgi:copper chaperone CopZ
MDLNVSGMHCANCSRTVETGVAKLPGVLSVSADALSGRTRIVYDPAKFRQEKVAPAVDKLGYKAELLPGTADGVKKKP